MNDFSRILEHIKLSEIRVAAVTKEIKEFEGDIKKHNEEIQIIKAKQKQIAEELVYKRKIVTEKEWELAGLKRMYSTWEIILKEKEAILLSKTDELDSMQNRVWNTRMAFHEKAQEFLSKHNFLDSIHSRVELLLQKQEERKNLLDSIEKLDQKVNDIEKAHSELKSNWDLIQHLEKERENLVEFELSPDVLRLQNKIANCTQELESLEKELSKYNGRATMTSQEILLMQNFLNDQSGGTLHDKSGEDTRVSFSHGKKKSFMPKIPSSLIKKQPPSNDNIPRSAQGDASEK